MKNKLKKLLSVLLCAAMTASATPYAFAEEDEIQAEVIVENDETDETEEGSETDEEATDEDEEEEFDVVEAYEYVMSLESEEDAAAYLESLTEEDYAALEAYAVERAPEEAEPIETVVFTDAGPFMPPVNVRPYEFASYMYMDAPTAFDDEYGVVPLADEPVKIDGVETKKIFDPSTNKITIEAYVTGETTVTSTTTYTPVDIVLVLDQSGSMAYDFNGKSTNTNEDRRQYAMKQAVNNFIESVGKKYTEDADHRIAIVTFGSDPTTLQGWTYVDGEGVTSLQGKINQLPDTPSGATDVAEGMTEANNLLTTNYSYAGTNKERQKVVIVFTDGVPTENTAFSTAFSTDVANDAIEEAKEMKDAGVTVYSVGIFNGADPEQLHGDKIDYEILSDELCNGTVDSRWGASIIDILFGDVRNVDIAAGNRFLNYLSNNFMDATEIGIKEFNIIVASGWEITKNFTRSSDKYYLTANSADSLNQIFQEISNNIQTGSASVELGTSTVIKDVISDYFTLPENADTNDIKIYTADYNEDGTWDAPIESNSLVATIVGKEITVTGFDFSANYCDKSNGREDGNNDAPGNFYGRKLIIEIPIEPEDDFLGGTSVPTNGTESGIYNGEEVVESFDVPPTSVDVKSISPATQDQNIYLGTTGSLPTVSNIGKFTVPGVFKEDGTTLEEFSVDGVNNAYVDIVYTICDSAGNKLGEYTIPAGTKFEELANFGWNDDANNNPKLTEDTTYYYINCTVISVEDESKTATPKDPIEAHINVFKPTVTWKDSAINLGETPVYKADTNVDTDNFVSVEWTHSEDGNKVSSTDVTMTGVEPTLTYEYDPAAAAFTTETKVSVTVSIGSTEITSYVTFVNDQECDFGNCSHDYTDCEFIVHIKSFNLTIKKEYPTGEDYSIDENQSFVFTVTGANSFKMTVVIHGNDEITITGLPSGTYTVTEDENWSWRYTPYSATIEAKAEDAVDGVVTVTFTNKRETSGSGWKWLNGCAYATNKFTANTVN